MVPEWGRYWINHEVDPYALTLSCDVHGYLGSIPQGLESVCMSRMVNHVIAHERAYHDESEEKAQARLGEEIQELDQEPKEERG